jgi:hypothetical protein
MSESFAVPTPILDGQLWISGCPIDYEWLRQERIDLVIDVADPDFLLVADRLGSTMYRKEALVDGPELPKAVILEELVRDVVTAVAAGRRVMVACAGGRNRSGLVLGLALRELLACSGAEALHLVQSRREDALNNETFARYLAALPPPRAG